MWSRGVCVCSSSLLGQSGEPQKAGVLPETPEVFGGGWARHKDAETQSRCQWGCFVPKSYSWYAHAWMVKTGLKSDTRSTSCWLLWSSIINVWVTSKEKVRHWWGWAAFWVWQWLAGDGGFQDSRIWLKHSISCFVGLASSSNRPGLQWAKLLYT